MNEHLSPQEKKAKQKLNPRGWKAKHQWEQAQPELVRGLRKEGRLYRSLLKAQERALQVYQRAVKSGPSYLDNVASHERANELANQEIFLPEGQELLGQSLPGETAVVF